MENITLNEANAQITEQLHGKTIDYVYREGLDLIMVTSCGHEIHLAATTDHHIVHKRTDVKIVVPSVQLFGAAGKV